MGFLLPRSLAFPELGTLGTLASVLGRFTLAAPKAWRPTDNLGGSPGQYEAEAKLLFLQQN
jgi:hypothetical protein